MPLMKSPSKKAFSKNVKMEMDSGKPQDQSLAIAYSVKRKNAKKKMANGGPVSAKVEQRPMPDQRSNDAKQVAQADHKKSNGQDGWIDTPTKEQAVMNNGRKVKPIKHPSMQQSPVFKTKLRDQEDDLEMSADPGPYGKQPQEDHNEEDADKSGPSVPSLKMKRMAEGGMINKAVSMRDAEEDMDEHPAGEMSDNDQMKPSDEEIMANHFAEGGEIDAEDEMAIDHAASIAAAIMAKRRYARGGEILSEDSMESDDSDQADLSRNAEEDANMEDKASFDALRKENYSESDALEAADHPMDSNEHSPEHDEEDVNDRSIVSMIRRKMKAKSPISR